MGMGVVGGMLEKLKEMVIGAVGGREAAAAGGEAHEGGGRQQGREGREGEGGHAQQQEGVQVAADDQEAAGQQGEVVVIEATDVFLFDDVGLLREVLQFRRPLAAERRGLATGAAAEAPAAAPESHPVAVD
jgi:hypothetical protein